MAMEYSFYLVDAFVQPGRSFSGNPAGVCILQSEQPASWMQQLAAEMNQAETAFLLKRPDGAWQLRWFTPTQEVKLCGHATLAAAHVLWQQQGETTSCLTFHTAGGRLSAQRQGNSIALDFPADPPVEIASSTTLEQLLGRAPLWEGKGDEYLLAVMASAQAVRDLVPNIALIKALAPVGLIVTAQGDEPGIDMVSRFFAPNAGINEDAVTGSAHCTLAVYWAERLGKHRLQAVQASARSGLLAVELQGARVQLIGLAQTRLTGVFHD
jgi:PhzF family phenazine biosynthesis protein